MARTYGRRRILRAAERCWTRLTRTTSGATRMANPGVRSNSRTCAPTPPGSGDDRSWPADHAHHEVGHLLGLEQLAGERHRRLRVIELVVQHRRPHPVGADAADVDVPDPGHPQVRQGGRAEAHDRVLRPGIDGLTRHGHQPGERRDVDDVATTRRAHHLQGGDRAVHRPERVDLEHQPPLLVAVLPRRGSDQHARVVDPQVERPCARHDRGGNLSAGLLLADVEHAGLTTDLGCHLPGGLLIDVGDVHGIPGLGEAQGDLATQPATCTGDDGATDAHDARSARADVARAAPRRRSRRRSHR